jgi:hypothetical protein
MVGDRPPPGPSTLAGGTAGPLGRMKARSGPTITNRTQTGLCAPTGSERHTTTGGARPRQSRSTGPTGRPFPQPGPPGRDWAGERPHPPNRLSAQRANRCPRHPHVALNGRPVGPDGMVGGSSTSTAFDPGWGNGWPLGPDDGPCGLNHPEPHTNRLVRSIEVAGGARHSWTEPGLPPWKSP